MPKFLELGNISNNEDDPLNSMDGDKLEGGLPAIESQMNLDDTPER